MRPSDRSTIRPLPEELFERIERAAPVLAEKGFEATRVDQLARVTGIPKATLYYYFPSKEHILVHLLTRTLAEMTARLAAAASTPGTGRERLTNLIGQHLVFIDEHGATYRLLLAALGRAGSLFDLAAGVDQAVLVPLRGILRAGLEDGTLDYEDIGAAASMVYGAVLATGMQHLLLSGERPLSERADALIGVVLGGLGASAPPLRTGRTGRGAAT